MRKSEILGLRWPEIREVSLKDNRIGTMIFLPAERTKTRTARKDPVSNLLGKELKRLKEEQRLSEAKTSLNIVTLHGLVFRRPGIGKALRRDKTKIKPVNPHRKDVRPDWDDAKAATGIDPGLHFHDLRRTFRTHMKRAHADGDILNEIMGHENPKIEKTYTVVEDDQLFEAISLLPDWNSHKTSTSESGQKKRLREKPRNPLI